MDKENLSAVSRKKSRKDATYDWERKYLGNILVSGQSSVRSERVINVKDKITFDCQVYFQKPTKGKKRPKLQSCWQNTILKFKTAKGAQLGIIDDDQISFMISNLMDAGVCEFEGQILPTGNNNSNENIKLSDGDEIFLEIKIYILVCLKIYFLLFIILILYRKLSSQFTISNFNLI
jgi:hypothetical protein